MLAFRQIIEDPQDVIPIPPEFRHRRTVAIFIAFDSLPEQSAPTVKKHTLISLAACWEGETLERSLQGNDETRRALNKEATI